MSLLGFKRFLVPMITKRDPWWKLGTIRALRKNPIQERDILHMYTGLRTKSCEYLGVSLCTNTYFFTMHLNLSVPSISNWVHPSIFENWIHQSDFENSEWDTSIFTLKQEKNHEWGSKRIWWLQREIEELAIQDGFKDAKMMWEWFQENHGIEGPQIFQRVEWKIPPVKLNRELTTAQQKVLLLQLNGLLKPLDVDLFMKHLRHQIIQEGDL